MANYSNDEVIRNEILAEGTGVAMEWREECHDFLSFMFYLLQLYFILISNDI
jgi:hypothetical protein